VRFERRPTEWPGWLWCERGDGVSGWAPESWVVIEGGSCRFLRDYDATELAVEAGERVEVEFEESGWAWVRKEDGERGWLPRECLDCNTHTTLLLKQCPTRATQCVSTS
jgi:uncharacterized protein CbrC (UPF0167 family)